MAVGGGSAIDAVKAAGHLAGIRWANCPTVASTDAPCSALSVIYTEDGEFEEYRFFPRNPDLVLVDSQVVANAPVQLLVAGVGDALATWLEARATARSNSKTMAGGLPTLTGTALAQLSWDVLWDNALQAVDAVRDNEVTPAVEKVIEANTLLSGLGFESGGLAAAHAVHNGLTAVAATHGLAHGQKVNIGSVTQLVLEGAPSSEIREFVEFTTRVGLPTTLTEVGLRADDLDCAQDGGRRRDGRGRDDPRDAVRGPQRGRGERARVDRALRDAGAARGRAPGAGVLHGAPLTVRRAPSPCRAVRAPGASSTGAVSEATFGSSSFAAGCTFSRSAFLSNSSLVIAQALPAGKSLRTSRRFGTTMVRTSAAVL